MSDTEFQIGESLTWSSRVHPDAPLTKRPVSFRGMKNHLCEIAFGLRADGSGEPHLYSVPREELTRPVAPQAPKVEPPPAAEIIPLDQRRRDLGDRYAAWQESQRNVEAAQSLLDRALGRVEQAQRELRTYADMDEHAVAAVVHAIKMNGNGHSISDDEEQWQARYRAERDLAHAEAAYQTLARELADLRNVAEDRLQTVQTLAAQIVAAVVEREVTKLSQIEAEAISLRLSLRAAAALWVTNQPLPVDYGVARKLTEWPFDHEDPVGLRMQLMEQRQQPYAELFLRLVNGEIDADI